MGALVSKSQYRKQDAQFSFTNGSDDEIDKCMKRVQLLEYRSQLLSYIYMVHLTRKIYSEDARNISNFFEIFSNFGDANSLFTMFEEKDNAEIALLCSNIVVKTYSANNAVESYNSVELFIKACRPVMDHINRLAEITA